MKHLNGCYTQRYNRKYRRVGHVFQGRYKAILVQKNVRPDTGPLGPLVPAPDFAVFRRRCRYCFRIGFMVYVTRKER